MPAVQVNGKSLRLIEEGGLRRRVRFLVDPGSRAIDALGLRLLDAEPMEEGMPHPTTLLLDREGRVRFVDVRTDYHVWLDSDVLPTALDSIP